MGWRSQFSSGGKEKEMEIWEGGVMGTSECFHFARAVGGTVMRAVTLFNKMPRKARGQKGGARGRHSGWGWQETVMR